MQHKSFKPLQPNFQFTQADGVYLAWEHVNNGECHEFDAKGERLK
jgi:hypothetical protein